ncbi:MAG: epoxyqueuosine reductase QueH, partial [Erysipelotrichaceae bacterium]
MNKRYYYELMVKKLDEISLLAKKPRLLLHSCCAPCNGYVTLFLSKYFDITLYFNNSNIYPFKEYQRRLDELKLFVINENLNIEIIENDYDISYQKDLLKMKQFKEGQQRCFYCYQRRMSEAYDYADKYQFDYFTTVMTISRQKDSIILNQIGEKLAQNHSTPYFFSDFKKNDGMLKALEVSAKHQ